MSGSDAKALLVAAVALAALLPVWWTLTATHGREQLAAEKSRVTDLAVPYRDALVRAIDKRFALVDALRAFVRSHPNPVELRRNFDSFASGLHSSTTGVRALEIMPGGITDFVYPLAGNERILGHDMFKDPRPEISRDLQRTLQTGRLTVTDPLELWQGGIGMIARQALFDGKEFWGFVTVVLDFPEILREAGIADMPRGLELALRDRSGRIISGSETVFRADPILETVHLAEGTWTLAAVPAGGWQNATGSQWQFSGFILVIAALFSALVYFIAERQFRLSRAVQEGDERYRVVTDAVPVVIAYVDREERYQFSNRASQQWFDRVSGDPSGSPLPDVLGLETYRRVKPEIEAALAGRQASFEMTASGPDGTMRHLKAVCIPRLMGNAGNGFYLLVTDVSDLKAAERAALESRDFLQRLLEDFPALVWRSGADGECRYFNRSWLEFTGRGLESECWQASVHPEDLPRRAAAYREAFEARRPFEMEYRLLRHDGEYRTVLDVAKPFVDADGNLEGYVGCCYDITGRKRAEEALKRTNSTLEALIQASPLSIVIVDPSGKVLSWNPAATSMFGFTAEDAIGKRMPIVAEPDLADYERLLAAGRKGELLVGLERRRRRKDGSPIDVSIWTAPMKNEHGQVVSIMSMHADITERKQLEQQLRQSQKMEAVGRLAGGVAHDFNNLLSIIAGYGHMLGSGLPPEAEHLRRDLDEILKAGERASELTKQLLAFSRRQVVQARVLDLNLCIGGVEKMLRRLIGEDVELRFILDRGAGRIKADPGQLEQVLMNLAVNARDAMPQGGTLTIETANVHLGRSAVPGEAQSESGDYVMLAVVDTGVGMDAETLSHVFEPFFTTKERGKGTGLGLSTVYGIVKQSGGDIRVYSQAGSGATFLIYFPRVDAAAAVELPAPPLPAAPARAETILLVEDEPGVRGLVREVLQRAGYRVLEAGNAGEALLICEQHANVIHLMLTDVVMPKMGGGELAKRLAPLRPAMRVLFMSGYMDDAMVRHGVQNSGLAFIQKPLAPAALIRKVREVLDAPAVTI